MIGITSIRERYTLSQHLDERGRRVFAATEAKTAGYGGIAALSRATGIAASTIGRGLKEAAAKPLHGGNQPVGVGRRHRRGFRLGQLVDLHYKHSVPIPRELHAVAHLSVLDLPDAVTQPELPAPHPTPALARREGEPWSVVDRKSDPSAITGWDSRATARVSSVAVPALVFLGFIALLVGLVLTNAYPSSFDELEHVSYSAYLQETHQLRPMFEVMQTLVDQDMTRWDDRSNYLGHPSPFYWYETLFLDRSLPPGQAITHLRLGSAALGARGIGLSLLAGWRAFGRDPLAVATFCAVVALCPKLLAVTGQVTNDALAILAGGLAYWGVSVEERRRVPCLIAAGLGLTLAMWAKPNAGLAVGAALGLFSLMRFRSRPSLIVALVIGAAAGSTPYWFILAKYGALVPITVEQFGRVEQIAGFMAYLPAFVFAVAYTFCFDRTGIWPIPDAGGLVAASVVWALVSGVAVGGILAL